jgi:hypothetical protein
LAIVDVDSQSLSQFAGNLPISRTYRNLPASRLDNIDMSKVNSRQLNWKRIDTFHEGVNSRFVRIEPAWENNINTGGTWVDKFRINTNLRLIITIKYIVLPILFIPIS